MTNENILSMIEKQKGEILKQIKINEDIYTSDIFDNLLYAKKYLEKMLYCLVQNASKYLLKNSKLTVLKLNRLVHLDGTFFHITKNGKIHNVSLYISDNDIATDFAFYKCVENYCTVLPALSSLDITCKVLQVQELQEKQKGIRKQIQELHDEYDKIQNDIDNIIDF